MTGHVRIHALLMDARGALTDGDPVRAEALIVEADDLLTGLTSAFDAGKPTRLDGTYGEAHG